MSQLFGLLIACGLAIGGGFGLTFWSMDHAKDLIVHRAGVWAFYPQAGSPDADPYQRAITARDSTIPMGIGEGLALIATQDDLGRSLSGMCSYTISGRLPAARMTSLSVYTRAGQVIPNPANRFALTGADLVRDQNGEWTATISAVPSSGNWLPMLTKRDVTLVLRLYGTPLSANASGLSPASVPSVHQTGCTA